MATLPIMAKLSSELLFLTHLGQALQRTALHESDLYIEPDEGLAVGDLIVESCGRRVSSILKEQLERLEEVLYE